MTSGCDYTYRFAKLSFFIVFAVIPIMAGAQSSEQTSSGVTSSYDFSNPSNKVALHKSLKEASGLSVGEKGALYVVEDENGVLYTLDALSGEIVNRKLFASDGDFEGVEYVRGVAHILRSSGHLYFTDPSGDKRESRSRKKLDLPGDCNAEALGFEREEGLLLVGCKVGDGIRGRRGRSIYAFDTTGSLFSEKPFLYLNKEFLSDACGGCSISVSDFQPSAIAVQPGTGDIYILSAVQERLLVVGNNTNSLTRLRLDDMLQPEGIAFDDLNRLYILSEGNSGRAHLFRFDPIMPSPNE